MTNSIFKRIGALLMTMLLVLALVAMPALAVPGPTDTVDVSITGFGDKTPTVTLYQVWQGDYSGAQFAWDKVSGTEGIYTSSEGAEVPVASEVHNAANQLQAGTMTAHQEITNGTITGGTYTANVGAGVYIAVITPADGDKTIYNPVLLAASYDGSVLKFADNPVDITQNFVGNVTGTAQVKTSTPTVDKEASATPDTTIPDQGDNQTASVGQVITYTVTPTMPMYPAGVKNETFYFSDTLSEGLTFDFSSLTVKWNGKDLVANAAGEFKDGDTLIAKASQPSGVNGFNLYFDYDNLQYITPTLEYKAVLNENAVVGVDGNPNKVEMYYTNQPSQGDTYENLTSKPQEGNGIQKEEKEEKVYTYQVSFLKKGTGDDAAKLAGAVFGVYSDEACTKLVDTVTTNENGYAISTQVGYGQYWIKELKAPAGYALNSTVYPVTSQWTTATTTTSSTTITTEYTSNIDEAEVKTQAGWLKDNVFYNLDNKPAGSDTEVVPAYIKGTTTNTSSSTSFTSNTGGGSGTIMLDDILNTKTPSLPSTGSIGTYLFTLIGVAVIAFAIGLVIVTKKKRNSI